MNYGSFYDKIVQVFVKEVCRKNKNCFSTSDSGIFKQRWNILVEVRLKKQMTVFSISYSGVSNRRFVTYERG